MQAFLNYLTDATSSNRFTMNRQRKIELARIIFLLGDWSISNQHELKTHFVCAQKVKSGV
jgi:hypothetical protein